jgi:rhodanese-related sulfurtransferase
MRDIQACKVLRDMIATEGWILVDVRQPHEFYHSHIEGAVNIPVADLVHVEPDNKYLLYCNTGARSGTAANYLKMRDVMAINIGGINNIKECLED